MTNKKFDCLFLENEDGKNITSSIKTLEVERTELEEKTKEAQELILVQQSRADVCSEDLLTHRVSLTEITEQQKNTEETVDRLRRESSEIELRLEQLEKSRNDAGIRLDKSRKRITEIDGSFVGMLESRTIMYVTQAYLQKIRQFQ